MDLETFIGSKKQNLDLDGSEQLEREHFGMSLRRSHLHLATPKHELGR